MAGTPLVSFVMPCYNATQWLDEALQSIFVQTLADWELVAVDDASTDGTWEALQRLDDPRVRLARNERNLRHPGAVNRAIDMAAGKYIARMDADDVITPDRLEKQVGALEADPQVDVLGTGLYQCDMQMNAVGVRRPVTTDAEIKRMPTIRYPLTYGSLVGKAEWWKRWKVDPRAVYSTSFDLYLRSFRESVFANVPDLLYGYRYIGHTRNMSKMMKVLWDRAKSLCRNGFHRGLVLKTLIGLGTLAPRPLLYAYKLAIGSSTAVVPCEGEGAIDEADRRAWEAVLRQVRSVELPLKSLPRTGV
ncbi:MAG: glycosyltransferase family 2 protein [Planctomycetota bacterium]